jgi:nitrite reductase (cytochrome c-552)
MEKYYDESSFADWTHPLSRAPMLKAQHPDYEIWSLGIHARRGLACADCHMPYVSEGGVKYSDHHVQSPLHTVNRSCQVCHRESEAELVRSVYDNQDRVQELRKLVEEALVRAHIEAKAAWQKGASTEEMRPVLPIIRHAQWRWDFAVAGHGASAHAPVEVCRILGSALDLAGEARRLLTKILSAHGFLEEVPLPDLSSKEKAQRFVGLDMAELNAEKAMFLQTVVPSWEEKARKREDGWDKNRH